MSSKAKFTPGPYRWDSDDYSGELSIFAGRGTRIAKDVATVEGAALLAAAPDLYAALEAMVRVWGPANEAALTREAKAALAASRTALAKARGES